jgi:uncharacterized RDD family membrane protein YckC
MSDSGQWGSPDGGATQGRMPGGTEQPGWQQPGAWQQGPSGSGPSGPRAGFWRRFFGAFLDGIITGLLGSILGSVLGGTGAELTFILGIGYAVGFIGSPKGQTPGMRAMGIRAISMTDGGPIGYGRAAVRYVVAIPSAVLLFVGYLWMLGSREKQTWFDMASSSVVVPVSAYPVTR